MSAPPACDKEQSLALAPWILLICIVLAVLLARGPWTAAPAVGGEAASSVRLDQVLSENTAGFSLVETPRQFRFPADHGPHPDYRSEWWYFTGNVASRSGRVFGFQLTFFRFALAPGAPQLPATRWATRQAYMAHLAISDVENRRFYAFERFDRNALGLAGAQPRPFRVWLGDWQVRGADSATFPLVLSARHGGQAIELVAEAGKGVVLQGDRGFSQKSQQPGNASHYYSYTRLPVHGTIRVDGENHTVSGLGWMDREWGTTALDAGQSGWDWFALQLDDGRDLMFYRLRRYGGATDPMSAGVVVAGDGTPQKLGAEDVVVRPTGTWRSPGGGAYPAGWSLRVRKHALELQVTPAFDDQEHRGALRYWEGAVAVAGTSEGRAVRGRGYVELTGYGDSAPVPAR